jgi:hypothetical protein
MEILESLLLREERVLGVLVGVDLRESPVLSVRLPWRCMECFGN